MDLVDQAGGTVEGVGICIEKGFQGGGDALRKKGVNLKSLAIIEKWMPRREPLCSADEGGC